MSTFLVKGTAGANVKMGTAGYGYSGIGTIVSGGRTDTGDILEIKDRYGNVVAKIYFNERNECTFDAIFDSTVDIPVRSDSINIAGLTAVLVDQVDHKWEQGKERMLTIKATKHENLALS